MAESIGKVCLVGAGPGRPELMTLRARDCLAMADVILYDYLVNPRCLDVARQDAELICLGQHGRTKIWPQAAINEKLVSLAQQGLQVVRLKSGDPIVFARGAEEAEALDAAGIPIEIVPGVTSALAAAACAGIPLTHRDFASAVALVTGHGRDDTDSLDFARLAHFPGTLAIYMGVTTAERWTTALIDAGMAADTSAALIRRVSYGDQTTWTGQLDQIADHIRQTNLRPPVIALIGPAARQTAALGWFESRPLFGLKVLVTRARHQSEELVDALEARGAEAVIQPTISISPPVDWTEVDASIHQLSEPGWDWIVFSSSNGVTHWMDRLLSMGDIRQVGDARFAAVGPATAEALARYHIQADLIPHKFHAEGLIESFRASQVDVASDRATRVLLVRGSRGRDVLRTELTSAGMEVTQVVAYQSSDVTEPSSAIADWMAAGQMDWVIVSSSAIGASLHQMFGDVLHQVKIASISPITSDALRKLGCEPTVEASEHTMEGLVAAIQRHVEEGRCGSTDGIDQEHSS